VRELIASDAELISARGGDGQTPLHFASTVDIAAYLLDQGAEIDARDVDHESTPAQYMIDDRQEVARYLIQRGCKTDILMAAALGDMELVRRHLDADPGSIRMCVSEEFFPMISPKAGGTIYQWKLGWYLSPHRVALKFGHEDVYRLLMDRSPPEVKLIEACWLDDEATLQALGADQSELARRLLARRPTSGGTRCAQQRDRCGARHAQGGPACRCAGPAQGHTAALGGFPR